jgi:hypothetical protein
MSFQGIWADIHNSIRVGWRGFFPRVQIEFQPLALLDIHVSHYGVSRVGGAGEVDDRCAHDSIREPDFGSETKGRVKPSTRSAAAPAGDNSNSPG